MQLASLVAEAAGGLSDRDRLVLELTYRHGLDGPELAEALGVSQSNANTLVYRLRDTIERCLGALLVSRRVQRNPARCPELAALLHGWDGRFTILMRKRISRHIESCPRCEQERRRLVSPVALLGGAPVFIPAPAWLRDRTMGEVGLTSSATGMATAVSPALDTSRLQPAAASRAAGPAPSEPTEASTSQPGADEQKRRMPVLMGLLIGVPLVVLGITIAWLAIPEDRSRRAV